MNPERRNAYRCWKITTSAYTTRRRLVTSTPVSTTPTLRIGCYATTYTPTSGLSNTTTAIGVSKGGGGTSEGEGAEGGSDQESGVD